MGTSFGLKERHFLFLKSQSTQYLLLTTFLFFGGSQVIFLLISNKTPHLFYNLMEDIAVQS